MILTRLIALLTALITSITSLLGINTGDEKETETVTEEIQLVENLFYGKGKQENMDIAYPGGAAGQVDVILSIHGGAWVSGNKESLSAEMKEAASRGYIGVTMNHTYASATCDCDQILDEITLALKAVKQDAAERGIQVRKYIITGRSSGGHLATLYAYTRGAESGLVPAAVYNRCGPIVLDSVALTGQMIRESIGSTPEQWCSYFSYLCGETVTLDTLETPAVQEALARVSPTNYVKTAVPTIIAHGTEDPIVPYENAVILDNKLTEAGIRHYFITFPNSGHNLDNDPAEWTQATDTLYELADEFMSSCR